MDSSTPNTSNAASFGTDTHDRLDWLRAKAREALDAGDQRSYEWVLPEIAAIERDNYHAELQAEDGGGLDMAERLRLVVLRKLEMMADDDDQIRKANLKDLVLPWGIAQDKGMLAAEGNKVVVEHTKGKVGLEEAVKAIEEAKRLVNKNVIDVTEEKE